MNLHKCKRETQEQMMKEIQTKNEFKSDCLRDLESMLMKTGVDDNSKQYVIECLWIALDSFYNKFLTWKISSERRGMVIQDLEHHLFAAHVTNRLLKWKLKQEKQHSTDLNSQNEIFLLDVQEHVEEGGVLTNCCAVDDENAYKEAQDVVVESKVIDDDELFVAKFNDLIKKVSELKGPPPHMRLRRQSALEVASPLSDFKKSSLSEVESKENKEESEDEGCVIRRSVEEQWSADGCRKDPNDVCKCRVKKEDNNFANHNLMKIKESDTEENKRGTGAKIFHLINDDVEVESFKTVARCLSYHDLQSNIKEAGLVVHSNSDENNKKQIAVNNSKSSESNNFTNGKADTNMKMLLELTNNEPTHANNKQSSYTALSHKDNKPKKQISNNKMKQCSRIKSYSRKPNVINVNQIAKQKAFVDPDTSAINMSVFRPKKEKNDSGWVIREAKLPYFEIQILDSKQTNSALKTESKHGSIYLNKLQPNDSDKNDTFFKKSFNEIIPTTTPSDANSPRARAISKRINDQEKNEKISQVEQEEQPPLADNKKQSFQQENKITFLKNSEKDFENKNSTNKNLENVELIRESLSTSLGSKTSLQSIKMNIKNVENKGANSGEFKPDFATTIRQDVATINKSVEMANDLKYTYEINSAAKPQYQRSQQTPRDQTQNVPTSFHIPATSSLSIQKNKSPIVIAVKTSPNFDIQEVVRADKASKQTKRDLNTQCRSLKSIFGKESPEASSAINICKKLCS
ncbi:hypothetical protein HELRODRAFT_171527 [Helobdella robusta]|uniref:Uncharacterized protein n=1 Tax=Helobdella robusta TaxID=6412 RepID=T1F4D7_HELRO|nr:hypothetical protein HELRODRAFT_171527 [Helobdella robusta]ESO05187.1 hypothetical protein HELRODRAFT_171527 [Helobdella robusta]